MRILKWVTIISLSMCLIGVLAFGQKEISGSVDTLKYVKSPPYSIGLDIYWLGNSWSAQFAEEAKYEASLHPGVIKKLFITDSEGQVAKQVANLEDLIVKNPDIILVCPLSQNALVPILEKARTKGIPVVFYGGFARTDKVRKLITAEISVDDVAWGRSSAAWLVKKLNGKGNIICLSGLAGCDVAADRWEGAMSVFKQYPDIKILAHEYADWSYPKSKAVVASLLPAFPKIDGVWSGGASMSLGALEAFEEAGRPLPPITGEDFNGFLKVMIKKHLATIMEAKPTYIGSEAILTALKILRGEAVPKHIDLFPPSISTIEEANKFVRWDLPDTFWCHTRLPEQEIHKLYGGK